MTQNKALKCDHSCDCCEILCSDAIKKNNENLESQIEKIQQLKKENAELKKEVERLKGELLKAREFEFMYKELCK